MAILGLMLITAAVSAVEPVMMKVLFDGMTNMRSGLFLHAILGLAGLAAVREIASGGCSWLTWRVRLGVHFRLLDATVSRLYRLPIGFHRAEAVGAIMTRVDRSIQAFAGAVNEVLFNVLPAIFYLVISMAIMIRLEWRLALLVLAFAPLPGLIALRVVPSQVRRERALLEKWSRIYARLNEALAGILLVRSFVMEESERKRFLIDVSHANALVLKGVGQDAVSTACTNGVVSLARISAIAVGGWLIYRGESTVGTLVAFLGYLGGLFGPVQGLTGIYQTVRRASVSTTEIFSILDQSDALADAPDAVVPRSVAGHVRFEAVRFRYENRELPLLNGVNVDVPAGSTLAIVGPSGSGKTTLITLLLRFYDPLEGRVSLDGIDLRRLKQDWLRRNIGVVLQEPLLFDDTLRNNIAYGRPEASMAEVIEAARAANIHDFINRLPDGYDTVAGERGNRLSVGERQRITIARALIKDPAIVVLDEATSSLDADSEALVQDALDRLVRNRTTFVIAHRLSTVVNADRIIVLKDGRVTESGRHSELCRNGGYYARLVAHQTRGLIRNAGE